MGDLNQEAWKLINASCVSPNDGTKGTHVVIGFDHLQEALATALTAAETRGRLAGLREAAEVCSKDSRAWYAGEAIRKLIEETENG